LEEGTISDSDVVNDEDDNKDSETTRKQVSINGSNTSSHQLGSAKKSKGKPSVKRRKANRESGDMDGFHALMMMTALCNNAELVII
jgi:hypothetical protein